MINVLWLVIQAYYQTTKSLKQEEGGNTDVTHLRVDL